MEDLFEYITQGNLESLKRSIRERPGSLGVTNSESMTPLLFSMYLGKTEAARAMYETPFAFTVHEKAVMNDLEGVTRMLNADTTLLDSYSQDGWTALHLAAFFGHKGIVQVLLTKGAQIDNPSRSKASFGNSPLQAAIAMGQSEIVRLLLDHGANPNFVQQPSLLTPLHIAASRKDIDIVRLLLERGASREVASADGKKPADIADERQNPEIAKFLRED